MITKLMKIAVAAAVRASTLTACSSGETFPMASAEGTCQKSESSLQSTLTLRNTRFTWWSGARTTVTANWRTSSRISTVYYLDADNNDYYLSFQLTNGKFTTDGPEQDDRQTNSYACSTPLDLAAIDFDYLQKIGEKGGCAGYVRREGQTPDA